MRNKWKGHDGGNQKTLNRGEVRYLKTKKVLGPILIICMRRRKEMSSHA